MANNHNGHQRFPSSDFRLKPVADVDAASARSGSSDYYRPLALAPQSDYEMRLVEARDLRLKQRIRMLKLVSRVFAVVLSAATLTPLIITLVKFFQTRDVYISVDGEMRTAWAKDTITWYTYMYTGVSAVSLILNAAILISYWKGVKHANSAATVAGAWSILIILLHVGVWIASVVIYRYGREPVDGKFRDLWGWTCSEAAEKIQSQITDLNFSKYCTTQASSFYLGAANAAAGILSAIIYGLAIMRLRSKKRTQVTSRHRSDEAREPLRHS